jgi:hypothetical protein
VQQNSLRQSARESLERTLESLTRENDNLVSLRLRDLLTDEEFVRRRKELELKQLQTQERQSLAGDPGFWLEPSKLFLIKFNNRAVFWFSEGDLQTKRLILQNL